VCGVCYNRQTVGGKQNSWQACAADSTHTHEPDTPHAHSHIGTNQPAPSHPLLLLSQSPVSWHISHVDWWPCGCTLIHCDVICLCCFWFLWRCAAEGKLQKPDTKTCSGHFSPNIKKMFFIWMKRSLNCT